MLVAYLDESGLFPRARWFTVAAVVGTPKRWRTISAAWPEVLCRHGVIGEFKTAACVAGRPPYDSWSPRRRHALREALAGLIDRHALLAVGVSVARDAFEREVRLYIAPERARETPAHDPYVWCTRACMEAIAKSPLRGSRRVSCVFDEGYGGQRRAFDHVARIRDVHRAGWARVFPSLRTAVSAECPPLQAADLLAFELHHYTDRYLQGTTQRHPDLTGVFKRLPIEVGNFSGASLAGFRQWMEAAARGER